MPVSIRRHVNYPDRLPVAMAVKPKADRDGESIRFRARIMRRLQRYGWTAREIGDVWSVTPVTVYSYLKRYAGAQS